VAVQPYTKVEIHEMTSQTQLLVVRGLLRETGPDFRAVVRSVEVDPPTPLLAPSKFADFIEERGRTQSSEEEPITRVPTKGKTLVERKLAEVAAKKLLPDPVDGSLSPEEANTVASETSAE
jgi:hypothetical protein